MAVALVSLDEEAPIQAAMAIESAIGHMDRAASAVAETIAKVEEISVDSQRIDRIQPPTR